MSVEAVLNRLKEENSVNGAFLLEGDFYDEVIAEESSVDTASMGMPLVNRALQETLKREHAVCIFCTGSFQVPVDHVMVLEDGDGNRVGHDVPMCKMEEYKDKEGIFWLCEDFAVYPNIATSEEMLMVMLPQRVDIIGDEEGIKNATILYPATTTDLMLKGHFGIPANDPTIASAIISFDLI